MILKPLVGVVLVAGLTACSLAPTYKRPDLPVASQVGQLQQDQALDLHWQSFYKDPQLKALIEIALKNNRDLRVALANAEQAAASYGIAFGSQLPSISGQGAYSNSGSRASNSINRQATLSLALSSFEIDLWGKLRNTSEAAFRTYLASEETAKSTRISIIGQLASTYYLWREVSELEKFSAQMVKARQITYDLVERQYRAGVADEQTLNQAKLSLASAQASQLSYELSKEQAKNALELLLGQAMPADLPEAAPFSMDSLATLPKGLSSEVLLRRPDVMSAENALRAANANIGVARASFFPSISLTAALGIASPALSSLFEGNNRTWSVTPSASLPIFAGGTIYNNVKAMQASKKAAVATYEKAIQTAFQEVSDTLAGEESYAKQLAVLNDQVKAAKRYADIADVRYRSGTDTFLNVQTAQISYFQAQQSLITAQYNALSNRINLFKAIGGGWTNDDIKEN
ncbi:hypothetical protein IX83_05305 [Basilea psittacipulmonis DSM 24701]|uniref:Multidrug transporter n=4 Tax=Basilea TaxID=1472344 RepID=A0A077DI43_9BURK|nr:hypothetical protein IX83_05305 [Basilea psittacipulmonis DSM 24701]